MKKIIGVLFVFTILFASCEKDENTTTNQEQNKLTIGEISYVINQGKMIPSQEDEKIHVITFSASVQETTKSTSNETGLLNFTFKLHQLDKNELIGSYSLGDLNYDGIVNEFDAYAQGYVSEAFYTLNDENIKLKSGNLDLIKLESGTIQANFDVRNSNELRIIGSCIFE